MGRLERQWINHAAINEAGSMPPSLSNQTDNITIFALSAMPDHETVSQRNIQQCDLI